MKILRIMAHVTGWAIFLKIMFPGNMELRYIMGRNPVYFVMSLSLLVVYFYINRDLLVPLLLSKKKIAVYILVTLMSFAVICIGVPYMMRQLHGFRPDGMQFAPPFYPDGDMPPERNFNTPINPRNVFQRLSLYTHSVHFLIVFIVSTGLKVVTQWYREKQQLQELEQARIQTELSFLKTQIHPHFLFNCLNSIYYLSLSKDDNAPKAILSLSDYLRFIIIECESDFIPLDRELSMLEEYLNLQTMRTSEKFELKFLREGNFSSCSIMPLTFIPFVENAFKYGISAYTNCFIHINIVKVGGMLRFECDNSVSSVARDSTRSSGVGLDNIRKRLELAYPGSYSLQTVEDSAGFHVNLQIRIDDEMYSNR